MRKEAKYYESNREDLIHLVPQDAAKVLDVGCGIGALGQTIKRRKPEGVEVVGIEFDAISGQKASANLDQVIIGDVEKIELPFDREYFDCIIYGDILEHLLDPWGLVARHKAFLKTGGCLIASIPNIAHYRIIKMLRKKRWDYKDAGILDKAHIRFFTINSIKDMFNKASFEVEHIEYRIGASKIKKILNKLLLNSLIDDITEQYVVVVRKA